MGKLGIGTHATTIAPQKDGHNTINVTYHRTVVVSYNDRFITLDSGGYQTVTTKRRMNEASVTFGLGYQVFQVNFSWFVKFNGETIPFEDGMILAR